MAKRESKDIKCENCGKIFNAFLLHRRKGYIGNYYGVHRMQAEKTIGRALKTEERVIRLDRDTKNNAFYIDLKNGEKFKAFDLTEDLRRSEFESVCKMIADKLLVPNSDYASKVTHKPVIYKKITPKFLQ